MHENESYDEAIKTIKDGIELIKKTSNEVEEIKRRHRETHREYIAKKEQKAAPKAAKLETLEKVKEDFIFTGQYTDLRYFEDANVMPVSMIEKIPDADLKHCVKDEFNKSIADGLVELKKGMLTITEKGRKCIARPQFQKAAARDLQRAAQVSEQKMGVELNGTMQDLGYFKFSDQLNLTEIMLNGDYEIVSKITDNFKKMEDGGLAKIENGMVSLTDKGKEMLENPAFASINEKPIASVSQSAGAITAFTRKVVSSVTESVSKGKAR